MDSDKTRGEVSAGEVCGDGMISDEACDAICKKMIGQVIIDVAPHSEGASLIYVNAARVTGKLYNTMLAQLAVVVATAHSKQKGRETIVGANLAMTEDCLENFERMMKEKNDVAT